MLFTSVMQAHYSTTLNVKSKRATVNWLRAISLNIALFAWVLPVANHHRHYHEGRSHRCYVVVSAFSGNEFELLCNRPSHRLPVHKVLTLRLNYQGWIFRPRIFALTSQWLFVFVSGGFFSAEILLASWYSLSARSAVLTFSKLCHIVEDSCSLQATCSKNKNWTLVIISTISNLKMKLQNVKIHVSL